MPGYDAQSFSPPAPVAKVKLRNPDDATSLVEASLLMDTGADITLIPAQAVRRLGVSPMGKRYELLGFDGSASTAEAVTLDLVLLGRRFRGQYLLCEQPSGILGRDVLNHLCLVLDGPAGAWREGPA